MRMCTYFGTLKLIIMIILWTSICLQDAQAIRNRFEVVQRCPFNESEWKVRAAHRTCNGSESYHCLLTEGGVSLREQCTDASLFTSGFCPIFTNEGYLQWSACKDTACPTSSYRSDEVYQYQICYKKTDNPKEKNTEKGSNDSSSVTGVTIIIVAILLAFVLLLVLVVFFYKWNQCGFKDKVQQRIVGIRTVFQHNNNTEGLQVRRDRQAQLLIRLVPKDGQARLPMRQVRKVGKARPLIRQEIPDEMHKNKYKLKDLLKYFVEILKQELSVNDLKEKVVTHSKSINEHFTEPLIKELLSVKNINDYRQLDTSLVLTLLMNFCEDINAPNKGWNHEPLDDETHVGADIERIRSMWNKYCDKDFKFKHLDDVYNRMKQKYGSVAVHWDDGERKIPPKDEENEEVMEKLKSYILNEDCSVEKGIVITEGTTSALKIMKFKNVVILKGAIGCGKTHALMAIQNHFQEKQWETEWVEFQNVKEKALKEKPTILLWDNLFGRFGSCVFSQDDVDEIEEILKIIDNSKDSIKTVIGVHTHVFDEVKNDLKLSFLQQKNITVEMDKHSAAEALLIYKEQLRKGHCKTDSNCWFKTVGFQSVLDKLSSNQGQIGSPFLSLMYCNQHELFLDEAFSVNPIRTIMQHFQRMRLDSPTLYHCLVYLMCVQEHICEENPQEWAAHISVDITKDSLRKAAAYGYAKIDNNKAILAHDILTIVLFKSVAETENCLLPAVQNSEVDMMLQLFRPPGTTHSDLHCDFLDVNKDQTLRSSGKEFVYRYASKYASKYQKQWMDHPLLTIAFVKEKYFSYSKARPKHMKK